MHHASSSSLHAAPNPSTQPLLVKRWIPTSPLAVLPQCFPCGQIPRLMPNPNKLFAPSWSGPASARHAFCGFPFPFRRPVDEAILCCWMDLHLRNRFLTPMSRPVTDVGGGPLWVSASRNPPPNDCMPPISSPFPSPFCTPVKKQTLSHVGSCSSPMQSEKKALHLRTHPRSASYQCPFPGSAGVFLPFCATPQARQT